jgi:two-component system response regulator YesN
MLKILIADDEQPVLDGLQFLIKKHFEDMAVCATARNGREAMELVRLHQPDIVLMDVRMPGISGLDAIRDLRQSFPQMVFVLVTAYERFEIAKEAIDLGIQDYILKPLSREALIQVLQRARSVVRDRQLAQRREIGNRDWKEESTVFLEQALLFHAGAGTLAGKQPETLLRLLGLEGNLVSVVSMEWLGDTSVLDVGFERFREAVKFKAQCCFGAWKEGRFSILVSSGDEPWMRWAPQDIPDGVQWRGGVGSSVPISQAGQSLEESLWALEEGSPSTWSIWAPRASGDSSASYPFGLEKALLRALSAGDPDQAAFLTGPFWSALESLPEGALPGAVLQLVVVAAHHRGMEEGLPEPLDQLLAPFTAADAGRVPAVLKEHLRQTLVKLARRRPTATELSPVVEKAMDFLRKNFGKAISLEETARFAGVHPQYLSRMFSQEKGESFVDFLTRLRVSKAKELLRSGQNVKETAAEVGYADANYFSRLFKKWEGLSPGDYAQGKRGGL